LCLEILRKELWRARPRASCDQFQTLMLAAAVMFGGGFSIIVEGNIPQTKRFSELVVTSYSLLLAVGFGMLFISIVVSMKLVR
jgi:hypothetical protein